MARASTLLSGERGLKSEFAGDPSSERFLRGLTVEEVVASFVAHRAVLEEIVGLGLGSDPDRSPIGARPSGAAVGARAVNDLILEGAGADEVAETRALDLAARGLRDRPRPDEEHARGPVAAGREDPAHDLLDQVRVRLGCLAGLAHLRDDVEALGARALAVDAEVASSMSVGAMFSPPTMITSLSRPVTKR